LCDSDGRDDDSSISCACEGDLIIELPAAVTIGSYAWATADDAAARDPVLWILGQ
jgi:hypothetical protein